MIGVFCLIGEKNRTCKVYGRTSTDQYLSNLWIMITALNPGHWAEGIIDNFVFKYKDSLDTLDSDP